MVIENEIDNEQVLQIPLDNGQFIEVRISIASVPKVGPGPRPNLTDMVLMRRLNDDQVLIISAELKLGHAAAIVVGSGGPPR